MACFWCWLTLPALAFTVGCEQAKPAKPAAASVPPAKVEKMPGEADLTRMHLKPEAAERLGIKTAAVELREVPATRLYGGEVMIPAGGAVTVSSPLAGTLLAPEAGVPHPGAAVKPGQVVFRLMPLLSPEARATLATTRVEAKGQVEQARTQLAQAKIQLDRAERLKRDQIGSTGALADAQAAYNVSEATLQAATSRLEALEKTIAGVEGGTIDTIEIAVESEGILKNLHATAGQKVASGSLLFDVERLDRVWIRVPVYAGDLPKIATGEVAQVSTLGAPADAEQHVARPVPAPPAGDPLAATIDLFYEAANSEGTFRPGERVSVTLPLKTPAKSLVVPREAIIRDFDGGTWVYLASEGPTYARKRVRLARMVGPYAVLQSGPEPGTQVTTLGTAELFGIEFGGFK